MSETVIYDHLLLSSLELSDTTIYEPLLLSSLELSDTRIYEPSLLSSLELSDTSIYQPEIRALLGTAPYFCWAVVLKLSTVPGLTQAAGTGMASPCGDFVAGGFVPQPQTLNPKP